MQLKALALGFLVLLLSVLSGIDGEMKLHEALKPSSQMLKSG